MSIELSPNETIPARSRTFSPEVVKQVHDHLTGANGAEPVKNIGIGVFDSEGAARSALVTLNRMLAESHGVTEKYAGTVRSTDDGKSKAIILNRPAKKRAESNGAAATSGRGRGRK